MKKYRGILIIIILYQLKGEMCQILMNRYRDYKWKKSLCS